MQVCPSLCHFTSKKAELNAPSPTTSVNSEVVLVHYVKVVEGNSSPATVKGNTSPKSVEDTASPDAIECLLFTPGK